MAKRPTTMLGACGEYYVAAFLSGMGLAVALTKPLTPTTDLILKLKIGRRPVSIQVKTGGIHTNVIRQKNPENDYWVWRTGKKALKISKKSHWYAFVYAGNWPQGEDSPIPKVFFVPSKIVAKTLQGKETSYIWFWMPKDGAEIYSGLRGFRNLRKAIAG
jgi:hypothetical protein